MSEKPEQEQTAADEYNAEDKPEERAAASSVKKGVLGILLLILLSLVWYLQADRFTPYTSQARVQGYVVGVAPKVGGLVT
ncbi:MAG: HlyD family secretion protein, partial [Gammaproteobacteria bacterium]